MRRRHFEAHHATRVGWLRAAVLGANDGIVSVSSLLVGVAAAQTPRMQAMLVGLAGLVAGAMSMAAGEYVSVSSQADSERSDLERERRELEANEVAERAELAGIYVQRGLSRELAGQVADALMAHDALGAHARDELGLVPALRARPLQAAATSAWTFALGAALPLLSVALVPSGAMIWAIAGSSLACLLVLGAVAARAGGADPWVGALRVVFWGACAMLLTAALGRLFGALA